MSAADLLQQAPPSPIRAPWCVGTNERCLSVLIEDGDVVAAGALLDTHADKRGMAVVEVCRVTKGKYEAAYAWVEPGQQTEPEPTAVVPKVAKAKRSRKA